MDEKKLFQLEKKFFLLFTKFKELDDLSKDQKHIENVFELVKAKEDTYLFSKCLLPLFIWGVLCHDVETPILRYTYFLLVFLFIASSLIRYREYLDIKKKQENNGIRTDFSHTLVKEIKNHHNNKLKSTEVILAQYMVTNYYYTRLKFLMGEDNFIRFKNRLYPEHLTILEKLIDQESRCLNSDHYEKYRLKCEEYQKDKKMMIENFNENEFIEF